MFLFLDIRDHLPESMRADAYPFPFRKEALETILNGDEVVIPHLILELPIYLTENPADSFRYQAAGSLLASSIGNQAFEKEQYILAADLFRAGLACDPENLDLKTGLGKASIRAGNLAEGIDALGWLLSVEPAQENISLAILLADALKSTGADLNAVDLIQAFLKVFPDHPDLKDFYQSKLTNTPVTEEENITKQPPDESHPEESAQEADSTRVIRAKIKIISGIDTGKSLTISGRITIGRAEDNVFRLNDRKVSRHHALLMETPYGWVLEDLKSSNGTTLNGALLTGPTPVKSGDVIQIGDNDLQFVMDLPFHPPAAKECPQCGKPVGAEVAFCGSCGARL